MYERFRFTYLILNAYQLLFYDFNDIFCMADKSRFLGLKFLKVLLKP